MALRQPQACFSGRTPAHYSITRLRVPAHRRLPVVEALVLAAQGGSPEFFEQQRPARQPEASQQPEKQKPLVRVKLSVHYRVHSRQMLCCGGSHIPFGWSFLSIAKVPMTWNQGDVWTCEVRLLRPMCHPAAPRSLPPAACIRTRDPHAPSPPSWNASVRVAAMLCCAGGPASRAAY